MDRKWQLALPPPAPWLFWCDPDSIRDCRVTPLHAAPVIRGWQFLKETPKHKAKFRYKAGLVRSLPVGCVWKDVV